MLPLAFWKAPFSLFVASFTWLIIWLISGPHDWRHIDDTLSLVDYITYDGSRLSFNHLKEIGIEPTNLSTIAYTVLGKSPGTGTYPPLWNNLYIPLSLTSLFLGGVDAERLFTLFLGWVTTAIINYLLCSNIVILNLIHGRNSVTSTIGKTHHLALVWTTSFIVFGNPEIFNHATTLAPYQLQIIPVLVFSNLLLSRASFASPSLKKSFFTLSGFKSLFILLTSSMLSFMTPLIVTAYILSRTDLYQYCNLASLRLCRSRLFNSLRISFPLKTHSTISSRYKYILRLALILILVFLLKDYILSLLNVTRERTAGSWAAGVAGKYDILAHIKLKDYFGALCVCLNSFSRIIQLAFLPYRTGDILIQLVVSSVSLSLIYLGFRKTNFSPYQTFSFILLLAFILLALTGKIFFAPTRHMMIIFPLLWTPAINGFISLKLIKLNSVSLLILLGLLWFSCFIKAHQAISYTNTDKASVLQIAAEANRINPYMGNNNPLLLNSALSSTFRGKTNPVCDLYSPALPGDRVFYFSHRNDVDFIYDDKHLVTPWSCLRPDQTVRKIKEYKYKRTADLEIDYFIYNGGSSLNAVLYQVQ